jgi:hypothetical protein
LYGAGLQGGWDRHRSKVIPSYEEVPYADR